jgi:hypothetical protein
LAQGAGLGRQPWHRPPRPLLRGVPRQGVRTR